MTSFLEVLDDSRCKVKNDTDSRINVELSKPFATIENRGELRLHQVSGRHDRTDEGGWEFSPFVFHCVHIGII